MKTSGIEFGKIVAYLLPGFVGLWGLSHHSWTVQRWFRVAEAETSLDKVSFVVLGSLAVGVVLSGFRWLIFDRIIMEKIFHITIPDFDYAKLMREERALSALSFLRDSHYVYYQFYSTMSVATLFAFTAWLAAAERWRTIGPGLYILVAVTEIVLVFCARDALDKFVARSLQILGEVERKVSAASRPESFTPPTKGEPHGE